VAADLQSGDFVLVVAYEQERSLARERWEKTRIAANET